MNYIVSMFVRYVCDGDDDDLQLGPTTMCETMIQGTKVSLLELQLRMVHTLTSLQQSDQSHLKPAGRIALVTGTDLQSRHRLTMESTFGYTSQPYFCYILVVTTSTF